MTWTRRPVFWVVVLLLGCSVYLPALGYGFISYDDGAYVFENRLVQQGLTWNTARWAFEGQHIGHYHPLTWLSHLLDVSLFALDGRWHHVTSVLLHATSTLLLFTFLQRATGHIGRSGVTALLFALHPVHVEPVVWISSRKDVLSAMFWMLALVAYERYSRRRSFLRYVAVLLAYVAGLLSKPMVVTLPVILLLLDYWPLGRMVPSASAKSDHRSSILNALRRVWPLVVEKVPLFILAGASAWVTTTSASEFGVMKQQDLSLWVRVQNSLVSYVLYLRQLAFPVDLSVHHDRFFAAPAIGQLVAALAVLLAITAVALRCCRTHPYVISGWAFYLVSFLPVIGLLQYGGHSMGDRYAYLPSIGAFVATAWGACALLQYSPNANRLSLIIAPLVAIAFGFLSILQTRYWRSSETLFVHALDIEPNSPRLHNLLGVELANRGAVDEAAQHYVRAIELWPSYTQPMNNLGVLLSRRGRLSEAIAWYRRLLEIEPNDAKAHANLALALARQGDVAAAEEHYRASMRTDPDYLTPRMGLARLLASIGRIEEAQKELETAAQLYPSRRDVRNTLEQLKARMHRERGADAGSR